MSERRERGEEVKEGKGEEWRVEKNKTYTRWFADIICSPIGTVCAN